LHDLSIPSAQLLAYVSLLLNCRPKPTNYAPNFFCLGKDLQKGLLVKVPGVKGYLQL
jgi:hypothetical protein